MSCRQATYKLAHDSNHLLSATDSTDYLDSIRAVVAENGTVEETSDYYPYGMQMPDSQGDVQRNHPYKFGGKEHLTAGCLNLP